MIIQHSQHAKTTGYTPEGVDLLIKSKNSHPVYGKWQRNRLLEDVEVYNCDIVWSATDCYDLSNDPIPAMTFKVAVPRGLQGLVKKLQSFHA